MKKQLISDFDTSYFAYDANTGLITNTKTGKTYTEANHNQGYIRIGLRHRITNAQCIVRAHRIAWFLHYGTEPNIIDHQDGDRTNNKISNLISTTQKNNTQNRKRNKNSTYMVGAYKCPNGTFKAHATSIRTGKQTGLGTYATELEAHYVATYYKVLHYANYQAQDIAHIPNHPYHTGQLANIVSKITDTSGNSALVHLSK